MLGRRLIVRALRLCAVLLAVSFSSFIVVDLLPGDIAETLAGQSATAEQVERVRSELGLDEPIATRYVGWLGGVLTGDLGDSLRNGLPVASILRTAVPASAVLIALTLLVSTTLGLALGVYGAYRPRSAIDRSANGFFYTMLAFPTFVSGMFLVLLFARHLGWFPSVGYKPLTEDFLGGLRLMVLPVTALALREVALYRQLLRVDMLGVLRKDYILLARANGFEPRVILFAHALRAALPNVITILALNLGALISNTVIVESIFGIPGLGSTLIQSINDRDYILMQGVLLIVGVTYVVANAIADLLNMRLDPRLRRARIG